MKKLYLLILINIFFIRINAQTFSWAQREGLYAYDYGYGIVTDNSGNVYVAGKYEGDAIFSGDTLPCQGNHDIYVAKYSSSGVLSWIRTGGGLLGDYAHALSTDGSYLYVAGEIEGNGIITFPGSSITLTGISDNDIFLAKYDLNGTLKWAISDGAWYSEKALGVTQDNSGNIYITGYYTDTTRFDGTLIPAVGNEDMFIAKYNSNGIFQWMQHAGGLGRDEGKAIKSDAAGNTYVCGLFSNGAVFDTTTFSTAATPSGHYYDAFLAKYSPSGSLLWVKPFGGDYDDVAWALTMDNAGKIYVTGEFNAYATFDTFSLTTSGNGDVFVAAFDSAGDVQWVSQAGGPLIDRSRGIGTDGTNLFITGQCGDTASFGSHSAIAVDTSDIFIAEMSNTGDFDWVMTVGGMADTAETLGYEAGDAITATPSGEVYATGALLDGGVFGSTTFSGYKKTDMFITKILLAGVYVPEINGVGDLPVYPNPSDGIFSLDVSKLSGQKFEMLVVNCLGQIVDKKIQNANSIVKVDLSGQRRGIYFVEIKTEDDKIYREKIILQ